MLGRRSTLPKPPESQLVKGDGRYDLPQGRELDVVYHGRMKPRELPVSELKRLLATSKDLSKVMGFFFDRFAGQPAFLDGSHPTAVPDALATCVGQVVAAIFPGILHDGSVVTQWQLAELPLSGIVHGTVLMKDRQAVVLWVRDMAMGVLAIAGGGGGNTLFARISVTENTKPQ